jgi:hypothetical protein
VKGGNGESADDSPHENEIIDVFDPPKAPWSIHAAALLPVLPGTVLAVASLVAGVGMRCESDAAECEAFRPLYWFFFGIGAVVALLAWAFGRALQSGATWAWYLSAAFHIVLVIYGLNVVFDLLQGESDWSSLSAAGLGWGALSATALAALLLPASRTWLQRRSQWNARRR